MSDDAEIIPMNPRFAAAVFFGMFAVFFTLFAKYTLLSLQDSLRLPLLPALVVVLFTGAYLGSLFGLVLAKCRVWYQCFLIGVLMAVFAILLTSLSILLYCWFFNDPLMQTLHGWHDYVVLYGALVLSVTLIIGVWLIPLTGFAAVYFNVSFLPGLSAVDKQRQLDERRKDQSSDE